MGSEQKPLPICGGLVTDPAKLALVKKKEWFFATPEEGKLAKIESLKGMTHHEAFLSARQLGYIPEHTDYAPPTFEEVFDL